MTAHLDPSAVLLLQDQINRAFDGLEDQVYQYHRGEVAEADLEGFFNKCILKAFRADGAIAALLEKKCVFCVLRMRNFIKTIYALLVHLKENSEGRRIREHIPRAKSFSRLLFRAPMTKTIMIFFADKDPKETIEDVICFRISSLVKKHLFSCIDNNTRPDMTYVLQNSPSLAQRFTDFLTVFPPAHEIELEDILLTVAHRVHAAPPFKYRTLYFFQGLNEPEVNWVFSYGFLSPISLSELALLKLISNFICSRLRNVALILDNRMVSREADRTYADVHGRTLSEKLLESLRQPQEYNTPTSKAVFTALSEFFDKSTLLKGEEHILSELLSIISRVGKLLNLPGFYSVSAGRISEKTLKESPPLRVLYQSLDFEGILRGVPDYRQHFVHSFNCFVLGAQLFHHIYPWISSWKGMSYDQTLSIWFLTAIFHDIGYSLTAADKMINSYVLRVLTEEGERRAAVPQHEQGVLYQPADVRLVTSNELARVLLYRQYLYVTTQVLFNIISHIDCQGTTGEAAYIKRRNIEKQVLHWLVNRQDHGICSAILFLESNMSMQQKLAFESQDPEGCLGALFYAADAIAFHDQFWQSREEKIDAMRNPFASMLAVCDLIQQEGRVPDVNYKNKYRVQLTDISVQTAERGIKIVVELRYAEVGKDEVADRKAWADFFMTTIAPYAEKWRMPVGVGIVIRFLDFRGNVLPEKSEVVFGC